MGNQEVINQALAFTKQKLSGDTTGHDDWHAIRVWKLAKHIAQKESGDLFVTELAAILHDIDDWKFNGGQLEKGGEVAREFLLSLGVSADVAKQVDNIISSISYKGANTEEQPLLSVEAKIVQDADRLDAIGAIGIARTFACGAEFKQKIYEPDVKPMLHKSFEEYKNNRTHTVNHFYEKLLLLKDRLHTQTAKNIAESRHDYMQDFLRQFYVEWHCEDVG